MTAILDPSDVPPRTPRKSAAKLTGKKAPDLNDIDLDDVEIEDMQAIEDEHDEDLQKELKAQVKVRHARMSHKGCGHATSGEAGKVARAACRAAHRSSTSAAIAS